MVVVGRSRSVEEGRKEARPSTDEGPDIGAIVSFSIELESLCYMPGIK